MSEAENNFSTLCFAQPRWKSNGTANVRRFLALGRTRDLDACLTPAQFKMISVVAEMEARRSDSPRAMNVPTKGERLEEKE